jgi:hypothetical protein
VVRADWLALDSMWVAPTDVLYMYERMGLCVCETKDKIDVSGILGERNRTS